MSGRSRWKKFALYLAALLAIPILSVAAFVQFEQHLLRWRAERLLDDIHSIQMGKSTWPDAQRLMTRWGRWGGWQGECTARRCDYQIVMEDIFHVMPIYQMPNGEIREESNQRFIFLGRPYNWFGGRFAEIGARIQVKDGIIWTKSIFVNIIPLPHDPFQNGTDDVLGGWAHGKTSVLVGDLRSGAEYAVESSICTGCKALEVTYTPFADPTIVNHLLTFRLDCLTRLFPCREPWELMPSAGEFLNHEQQQAASSALPEPTEDQRLEEEARDTKYIALGEITGISTTIEEGKKEDRATFQLIQSLKGAVPSGLQFDRPRSLVRAEAILKQIGSQKGLRIGDKIIDLSDFRPERSEPNTPGNVYDYIIPGSPRILAAVQRGIARDNLADVP